MVAMVIHCKILAAVGAAVTFDIIVIALEWWRLMMCEEFTLQRMQGNFESGQYIYNSKICECFGKDYLEIQ